MKRTLLALALAVAALSPFAANAGSVSATLSITVSPPALALVLNPSSATEACAVAAGTAVSQASTTGGDGNAVTFSLLPPTGWTAGDFVIDASTGAITVGSSGIAAADCGKPVGAFTVTASQS